MTLLLALSAPFANATRNAPPLPLSHANLLLLTLKPAQAIRVYTAPPPPSFPTLTQARPHRFQRGEAAKRSKPTWSQPRRRAVRSAQPRSARHAAVRTHLRKLLRPGGGQCPTAAAATAPRCASRMAPGTAHPGTPSAARTSPSSAAHTLSPELISGQRATWALPAPTTSSGCTLPTPRANAGALGPSPAGPHRTSSWGYRQLAV